MVVLEAIGAHLAHLTPCMLSSLFRRNMTEAEKEVFKKAEAARIREIRQTKG